jgi:hypothetical protein
VDSCAACYADMRAQSAQWVVSAPLPASSLREMGLE